MTDVFVVAGVFLFGYSAWEWVRFMGLVASAPRTGIPVFHAHLNGSVWALVTSDDIYGYKARRTGEGRVLVRPVSRFEPGPSAGPFLESVAEITPDEGGVRLTAYLPSGPFGLLSLVVLAAASDTAFGGLFMLVVGGLGLLMELNEVKLCFKRLERLALTGPPSPLGDLRDDKWRSR